MIVECPQCSSRYRVKDEKIPDSGGRISCPNCDNKFVVHPAPSGGGESDNRNLQNLAEGMEGETSPEPSTEDQATEVMNGGEVPSFLSEHDIPEVAEEDGTIEMRNPFLGEDEEGDGESGEPLQHEEEGGDDDPTAVVSKSELGDEIEQELENVDWLQEGEEASEGREEVEADPESGVQGDRAQTEPNPAQRGGPPSASGGGPSAGSEGTSSGRLDREDQPGSPRDRTGSPGDGTSRDDQPGPSPDRGGSSSGRSGRDDGRRRSRDRERPSERPSGRSEGRGPARDRKGLTDGRSGRDEGRGPTRDRGEPSAGRTGPGEDAGGAQSSNSAAPGGVSPGGGDSPGTASGPAPNHDGPWKLRADHGLTYEFPDTTALRDWMRDREEVRHLELSPDGSNFYSISEFPQIEDLVGAVEREAAPPPSGDQRSAQPGGRTAGGSPSAAGGPAEGESAPGRQAGPASGSQAGAAPNEPVEQPQGAGRSEARTGGPGQQPQSPGPPGARERQQEPPGARDRQARSDAAAVEASTSARGSSWTWVLWVVLVVLVLIAVALFLDISGMYPVGSHIPGVPTTVDRTGKVESTGTGSGEQGRAAAARAADAGLVDAAETGVGDEGQSDEVARLLDAARRSIDNNQLQTAIEKLSAAKLLDPERPKTYELLANVYEKLGKKEAAETNRNKAESLRSGGSEKGADADTGRANVATDTGN